MEDTGEVWIYTGNGNGTFQHTFSIPVGEDATGLSLVPGNGPGLFDLLVGNGFGDVLILQGRGDGTFQIQGSRVSLSVVPDLLGPGQAGVLVGDQQNNRVTVQAPSANGNQYTPVETLGSSSSTSEGLAPGDVQWAVLDRGATLPDAIVVGTGSNSLEVYRTVSINDGVPTFAPSPETYFVGTAPASVTVADLTGNGIPDMLVADQGSNDVSVIFGSYDAKGDWVGIPGPRLKSGGDGPIAVIVRDLTGDFVPDLAVVNGGSGTVTLLPGVGGGFFDDQQPKVLFNLGNALIQPPTFTGNTGLGYAVTAGGNLVRFDLDNPSAGASVVYSGRQVVAAQALPSGQVVVALADGIVDILAPQGNGLSVASELLPEGGTPALPSAIDVVDKSNGLFDVLVSSQGSDTIFVFSLGGAPSEAVTPPAGGPSPTFLQLVPIPYWHGNPNILLGGERERHERLPDGSQHEQFSLDELGFSVCDYHLGGGVILRQFLLAWQWLRKGNRRCRPCFGRRQHIFERAHPRLRVREWRGSRQRRGTHALALDSAPLWRHLSLDAVCHWSRRGLAGLSRLGGSTPATEPRSIP